MGERHLNDVGDRHLDETQPLGIHYGGVSYGWGIACSVLLSGRRA